MNLRLEIIPSLEKPRERFYVDLAIDLEALRLVDRDWDEFNLRYLKPALQVIVEQFSEPFPQEPEDVTAMLKRGRKISMGYWEENVRAAAEKLEQ
jgi:hypothetical protein